MVDGQIKVFLLAAQAFVAVTITKPNPFRNREPERCR